MDEIEKKLLRKFYRHKVWRTHHWREDTLIKGFPSHLRYRVKLAAEELRRKGYLIRFPTGHGIQWYANIEKLKEIETLMSNNDTLNE
ncbi:MAG: hypothetical protein KJ906_03610 [Nanoarchaeota archaeon]|nr:hypothetical protein [Nanoarchaeota archaeon]